jgi:hypothetical protein
MPLSADEEARVFRYLLGEASPDERSAIEERLFIDDGWATEIQAVEMELLRDYLRNHLDRDVRRRFEEHWLKEPGLRDKLEQERALLDAARPSWVARLRTLLAPAMLGYAVAFASLCVAIWLTAENTNLRNELDQVRQSAANAAKTTPAFASFFLSPGTLRGESQTARRFSIPANIAEIHLALEYPKASAGTAYRAVLQLVGDGDVASTRGTTGPGTVVVAFPTASLATGDYILRLAAEDPAGSYETIESYAFGVVRPR